jgi:hypothetical protein
VGRLGPPAHRNPGLGDNFRTGAPALLGIFARVPTFARLPGGAAAMAEGANVKFGGHGDYSCFLAGRPRDRASRPA